MDGRPARASVRDRSRARVIALLRARGVVSQADIARETGLSRTTVSGVVAELRQEGLVVEAAEDGARTEGRGGRPPVPISLSRSLGAVLGVDFGHSHVRVAVADLGHNVLAERDRSLQVDPDAKASLDLAAELVDEVLSEACVPRSSVLDVGMGVPGPVDRVRGAVGSATVLAGWIGVRAAEELSARLGLPVEMDNDANLGALAEHTLGAGRGCSDLAYLKLSSGIGCGLIVNGRPYRGTAGTAGEIGHLRVDDGDTFCYCGNRGCLETLASGCAIVEMLERSQRRGLTLSDIVTQARAGHPACSRAVADAGRHIGVAVANLCNLLNPGRVVVGGVLGLAGDLLLAPLRDSFLRYAVRAAAESVEIVPGQLGERAEVLGALVLALSSAPWQGKATGEAPASKYK
ncbi:MAG TPA: ROK family transcriptional regulator [Terriglobales bacterium]|nr:ROK family transcriptional regulator [Terriglobales bacterium]